MSYFRFNKFDNKFRKFHSGVTKKGSTERKVVEDVGDLESV